MIRLLLSLLIFLPSLLVGEEPTVNAYFCNNKEDNSQKLFVLSESNKSILGFLDDSKYSLNKENNSYIGQATEGSSFLRFSSKNVELMSSEGIWKGECIDAPNSVVSVLKNLTNAETLVETNKDIKNEEIQSNLIIKYCIDDPSICTTSRLCFYAKEGNENEWNNQYPEHVAYAKSKDLCNKEKQKEEVPSQELNCYDNPEACTDVKLCKYSTTLKGSTRVWGIDNKYKKEAKSRGLTCGVNLSLKCNETPSVCSDERICFWATKKTPSEWDNSRPNYIEEAKSRGLSCGVKVKPNDEDSEYCHQNPSICSKEELCDEATFKYNSQLHWNENSWKFKFVNEAKRRGLSCGVANCSSNPKECSDIQICDQATTIYESSRVWNFGTKYFEEAQKRNLSCGTDDSWVTGNKCPHNLTACDDKKLCKMATYKTYASNKLQWVGDVNLVAEAKSRGLSCGVGSNISNSNSSSQNSSDILSECGSSSYKNDCWGTEKSESDGVKWGYTGEFKNGYKYGLGFNERLSGKHKGHIYFTDQANADEGGKELWIWRNGEARFFENYKRNAKGYYSNSNVHTVLPALKQAFNKLLMYQRKEIHQKLKDEGMYSSTIDGKWGRNTLVGLIHYSMRYLQTFDLRNSSNISKLYAHLLPDSGELIAIQSDTSDSYKSTAVANEFKNLSSRNRKHIQASLRYLGYYNSSIDGLWGKGTNAAIQAYANSKGKLSELGTSYGSQQIFSQIKGEYNYTPQPSSSSSSSNSGYSKLVNNPAYGLKQALAICEPQASLAKSQARSNARRNNSSGNYRCSGSTSFLGNTGYGSYNCRDTGYGGGLLSGIAQGLSRGLAGKRAFDNVMRACLAEKGWRKN